MVGPRDRSEEGVGMRCVIALRNRGWGRIMTLAVLIVVAGCGYRRPSLTQVRGAVTLDGEPVAGADVLLVPVRPGRAARGLADEAGNVVFSTYASGDGVIPGSYKAIVSKQELTKRGARKMEAMRSAASPSADPTVTEPMIQLTDGDYRNLLPAQYAGVDTTDLTVTIEPRTRTITIALTSASADTGR